MSAQKNKTPPSDASSSLVYTLAGIIKSLLVLALLALIFVVYLYWQMFGKSIALTNTSKVITVKSGDTYFGLINKWSEQELISQPTTAKLYTKFFIKHKLQAGAYQIPAGANLATVLNSVNDQSKLKMVRVRIIEGKTSNDLFKNLAKNKGIKNTLTGLSHKQILTKIGATEKHIEGIFAPNTYLFAQKTADITVLKKLYSIQKQTLAEAWKNRHKDLPYKTPYEALIIASIIEKETNIGAERGKVAGVFVNRLRIGMRLQTDPTVIYGMGASYKGNIRKKDLQTKTAYNTYQIDGLPPTPIALPSKASIIAATQPTKTDALFFVANGTGGHTFTTNYADHKRAVAKFLQYLREQK